MAADSSKSATHAMSSDRRPAIWPWLVMPLIALTLFYCLDQLKKAQDDGRGPFQPDASESQTL